MNNFAVYLAALPAGPRAAAAAFGVSIPDTRRARLLKDAAHGADVFR